MSEIILENISKIYGKKKEVCAVTDLNLHIRDKEFLVLLGPSGCGKTSTLRMIAGLEDVSRGNIYFDGIRSNDLPPRERNIAMAFESYALYPPLSVYENIAFPLRTRNIKTDEINRKVEWAAKTLRITDILNNRPSHLSGGQQQRVSLARAIVRDPKAFLLDEPLSHLDTKQRQFMRAELKRLNMDLQSTIIYVTHDQKEAMALADRIVVMHNGTLQQIGTPIEIYSDPANEFVAGFIGEPPMNFIDCKINVVNNVYQLVSLDQYFIANINFKSIIQFHSKSNIRIGIRPRQIQLSRSQTTHEQVPVSVYVYESVGEKGIVTVKLGKQLLKIVTNPQDQFYKNEKLWINFPWKDLFFFSADTGERLRDLELND
ncbi:MAG: ABC transporter ATP-binding protein [Patescibacteria group bacterium]|nr:ABC transporter ATP-binding protein [Patescibacteria group bacterium]